MTYIGAIGAAQREAMQADKRVIIIGEDVEANVYGTTGESKQRAESGDFVEQFGKMRIRNTPISEEAMVGAAIGAAMTGLRPIVDLSYSSFLYMAMDQFVNQAAKNRYIFGGQSSIPVVFRSAMFYGLNTGAHHSDRPYSMFMTIPGLKILAPASASDAKGLMRSAVDSDDPVLIFEAGPLWGQKEEVPDEEYLVPFGKARIRREGSDVTLVPLDSASIIESVKKTGRLVIAEPAHRTCGAAAEISAIVAEKAQPYLKAPIIRVTALNMQIPFSPALERHMYPTKEKIIDAIRKVRGH